MNEIFKKSLLNLYKNYDYVYGPFSQKNGRQMINLEKKSSRIRKTISYPKAIMEVHLGRLLEKNETVDHIDKNFLNNDFSNLRILDRKIHASIDVKRRIPILYKCDYCGKEFYLSRNQLSKPKSGKFCSRICSGKYGKDIQLGLRPKGKSIKVKTNYFSIKDFENN